MKQEELKKALDDHKLWLCGNGGSRADLSWANLSWANLSRANLSRANLSRASLSWADLSGANLSWADLSGANLSRADLSGANLSWADLSGANLSRADLSGANLSWANLSGANLSGADLSGANLSGADLSGANLSRANLSRASLSRADLSWANLSRAKNIPVHASAITQICPQEGSFVAWKKCRDGVVAKLLVLHDAKRSNSTGRKCRASKVMTISLSNGKLVAFGLKDNNVKYEVNKITECDKWCEDRWQECAGGIHFFMTKEEAEQYTL